MYVCMRKFGGVTGRCGRRQCPGAPQCELQWITLHYIPVPTYVHITCVYVCTYVLCVCICLLVVVTTSKLCVFVYTHDMNMCIIMYIHVYKYNPLVYIRSHWESAHVLGQ